MEKTVTTVIPTYKRPKLLRRAILSVLRQTHPDVRVLVCDNASGDETEAVVARIAAEDQRVAYHGQPENIGFCNNFNYGLGRVETPFFSLLSDDDILTPNFYKEALELFDRFAQAMFVCLGAVSFDENNNILSDSADVTAVKFYKKGEGFEDMITGKIPGTWTAILFKKQVKDEIGLLNLLAGPPVDIGYVCHAAARFPFVVAPGIGAMLMAHSSAQATLIGPVNREWLNWYQAMANDIAQDEKIEKLIRIKAPKLFLAHIKRIGLGQLARGLREGEIAYAQKAAAGLRACGFIVSGQLLLILVYCFRYLAPIRLLLRFFLNHRQNNKAANIKLLNSKYAQYLEFTKKLNDAAYI